MFENLELQFLAELSSVRGVVLRCSGTAPARMNLMSWGECVVVSHCTDVDIYCTSQSQILACLGIYDPNQNFHRILPSEQVTSLPRLFCPIEEKSITVSHYFFLHWNIGFKIILMAHWSMASVSFPCSLQTAVLALCKFGKQGQKEWIALAQQQLHIH